MSSHDNATPIRILHNSAAHLGGYARCLGAILMGYLGKLWPNMLKERRNEYELFALLTKKKEKKKSCLFGHTK